MVEPMAAPNAAIGPSGPVEPPQEMTPAAAMALTSGPRNGKRPSPR
jgi:hypothetical protein